MMMETRPSVSVCAMKILVVEDEPVVQAYAVAVLSRAGFEVEVESNGDEAFRRYRVSGPYSLVLTDICHPGMDGFDLVKAIRRENRTQAIVIVTGNVDAVYVFPESADFRRMFKDIAVLEKPFRVQQLLKMVEAAMETRQETVLPSDAPNH
jgi:two-component system, OmpR family, alkaline phosphatase synthesis response regulator PhoP